MAAPAIEQVVDALVARISAIAPSLRPTTKFRRSQETAEAQQEPSRSSFRQFDVDVQRGADDSNEGRGVQNVGLADRTATFLVSVSYPSVGRAERGLEKVIASDAELLLRAVGRAANWVLAPTAPVHRAICRWTVNRSYLEADGALVLEVTIDVQYRDTE